VGLPRICAGARCQTVEALSAARGGGLRAYLSPPLGAFLALVRSTCSDAFNGGGIELVWMTTLVSTLSLDVAGNLPLTAPNPQGAAVDVQ